jgi:hypothetical protein
MRNYEVSFAFVNFLQFVKDVYARGMKFHTLRRATRRHIPEHCDLQSHRCENHKSYIVLTAWAL